MKLFYAATALAFAVVLTVSAPAMAQMGGGPGRKGDMMMDGKMMAERHAQVHDMMQMMKDMMGMMKEMNHTPTDEQKKKLDEMMSGMDGMMKRHDEMIKKWQESRPMKKMN